MMSMTGFGRATAVTVAGGTATSTGTAGRQRRVVVEVRSVNHRNLDVKVRGRTVDAACEVEIIRAVRAAVARGSVQVTVEEEADSHAAGGPLERMRAAYGALEALRAELKVEAPVSLDTVAAFLRLERERGLEGSIGFAEVEPALNEALRGLAATRSVEGNALAVELRARAVALGKIVTSLRAITAPLAERAQKRLVERLAAAAAAISLDPARLAQEAALLADRLDVSEELARLETHRARLDGLLAGGQEPGASLGRTLDFLLQELGRELNTIGAKSQDAEVASLVIAGKAELEKIREQAQNIE
jgi:uncharacterized protein (TIGR00255 family)